MKLKVKKTDRKSDANREEGKKSFKRRQRKVRGALLKVEVVALTNCPYGAVAAEQQGASVCP